MGLEKFINKYFSGLDFDWLYTGRDFNKVRIDFGHFLLTLETKIGSEFMIAELEIMAEVGQFIALAQARIIRNFQTYDVLDHFCIMETSKYNSEFEVELGKLQLELPKTVAKSLLLTPRQIAKYNLLIEKEIYSKFISDFTEDSKSAWFFECEVIVFSKNQAKKLRKLSIKNSSKFPFHKQSADYFLYKAEQAQIAGASIY